MVASDPIEKNPKNTIDVSPVTVPSVRDAYSNPSTGYAAPSSSSVTLPDGIVYPTDNGPQRWRSTSTQYVLAFHVKRRVRMLGFVELWQAESMFNMIPAGWAKVVVDIYTFRVSLPSLLPTDLRRTVFQTLQSHAAHQKWITICETVVRSAISADIQFMVAFHQDGRVAMLGSSTRENADIIYDLIPDRWAKVMVCLSQNQEDAETTYSQLPKEPAKVLMKLPENQVLIILLLDPNGLRVLGAAELEDAEMAYDFVSRPYHAKTLIEVPDHKVLRKDMISQQLSGYKSGSISIAACEIETFVISTLACRLYPLNTRHHLVAYHKKGLVRVFTSSGQEDALAAYRQISKQWCKVLMSVSDNQILKSHGGDIWRRICQATLRSIALTASRIIPREVPYFLIAFHERDRVRILSCTRQEDAQDVYNQISQQWSKVLMSVPDNKILDSHGDVQWVKLCMVELHATAPLSTIR
ncbi:hypothetical protein EIP86_000554 [Pleurotus ostreatoroseus]|nr:hypothetical protein EIP86_000554 [Pleurotus ostreatoroseus]